MATFTKTGIMVIGNAPYVIARTGTITIGVESPPGIQKTGTIAIGNLQSSGYQKGGTVIAIGQIGGTWEHIMQRTGIITRGATNVSGAGVKSSGGAPAPGGTIPGKHGGKGRGPRQPTIESTGRS